MSSKTGASPLSLAQVALNTTDLSGSLQLYSCLFGFENGGSTATWGKTLAIQGLPEDARCIMWWLVNDLPFFQIELFRHDNPGQRTLPEDWRPSDHGWVRLGVAVNDFDHVLREMSRLSVNSIGQSGSAPVRRLAFRDPFVGNIVEVLEREQGTSPQLVYVTSSVADITAARRFYSQVVGAELRPLEQLHKPEDDALWGLPAARREGFLACLAGGIIEVVSYSTPIGRPRRVDRRSSDQGILNVGLGSREKEVIKSLIGRVHEFGLASTVVVETDDVCGTYILEAGYELELMAIAEHLDEALGFKRAQPFSSTSLTSSNCCSTRSEPHINGESASVPPILKPAGPLI